METYAVHLRPRGSLASWPLSSDTLFGAVCWGIKILNLLPDLSEWLSQAIPPFASSAAFPALYQDGRPLLRFYPRPVSFAVGANTLTSLAAEIQKQDKISLKAAQVKLRDLAKLVNGLTYVSEGIFEDIVLGKLSPVEVLRSIHNKKGPVQRSMGVLMKPAERQMIKQASKINSRGLFQSSAVQHNQIDRIAGATAEGQLFYQVETYFSPGCGLWALVRAAPDDFKRLIHPALRYLEDTGLGANRTTGKGHFQIDVEPAPGLPEAPNANARLMVSRYLPREEELADLTGKPLAYRLTTLRAKREQKFPQTTRQERTPPVFKQTVRMFEPGSVFPLRQRQEIYGKLTEVVAQDDGGPVFQSGGAIPVFLSVREGEHEQ